MHIYLIHLKLEKSLFYYYIFLFILIATTTIKIKKLNFFSFIIINIYVLDLNNFVLNDNIVLNCIYNVTMHIYGFI